MESIETQEQFEKALEKLVTLHTTQDRTEVADAIIAAVAGHPREDQITQLLDGLCRGSHNLAGRVYAAEELRRLVNVDAEAINNPPATIADVLHEIETVHYADGSSATGVAPMPDHSPEGAPAVEAPESLQE